MVLLPTVTICTSRGVLSLEDATRIGTTTGGGAFFSRAASTVSVVKTRSDGSATMPGGRVPSREELAVVVAPPLGATADQAAADCSLISRQRVAKGAEDGSSAPAVASLVPALSPVITHTHAMMRVKVAEIASAYWFRTARG